MKIYLSCPQCSKESKVEIVDGSEGDPKEWYFDCQFCDFKKRGDFSFLERLLSSFLIFFPTILFLTFISRFSDSPYIGFIVILGVISSVILGILASQYYLKLRIKDSTSHS